MREIVLDTETTGFAHDKDDRIVEIGAIELINHLPSGPTFHVYIDPERVMPPDAFQVHGLSDDFLRGKPKFAEIATKFLSFIGEDANLVIHNAKFDMAFLNAELKRAGRPAIPWRRAVDTVSMARQKFPGAQVSLDALCRRFGIDNSSRTLHGALLDAELLAEVYLELIGGRQPDLAFQQPRTSSQTDATLTAPRQPRAREKELARRLTPEEAAAHQRFVAQMGDASLWRKYMPEQGS